MSNIKFPECIYLGEFYSQKYGDLPAYIPANLGGFCLYYQDGEVAQARRLIENITLCILEDAPAGLLKVDIIDFANRPSFPFLNQLKSDGLYQISLNEQASTQLFNELENLIQYRYQNLFSGNESHLDAYNARSPRPENYRLLIIDTTYFPTNNLSVQRIKNFIQDAYDAGVYIMALHNANHQPTENHQKSLNALLTHLTPVHLTNDFSWLDIDETLLPVAKMAEVGGFEFVPADVNQTHIIEQLKSTLTAPQDNGATDFLHIAIGQKPNGETAYLQLGDKSENYSVVLLGVPGSGKSSLMNNIITQITKEYHAGQIRLHLVDFAGVEFGQFKDSPNVEKIFLDVGEPQYGIAFLEELRPQVEQRKALFMANSLRNIAEYNTANPTQSLPHIIVMIDEFHRLFRGDYRHQARVNALLEEIIREWRKFGVYLFLCTQTLQDVPMDKSLVGLLGLRMSYRVSNEATLGFNNMFHKDNVKQILALGKYEILAQINANQSHQALVSPPMGQISQLFTQLCLSRPAHLQVQAQVTHAHKASDEQSTQSAPSNQTISQPSTPKPQQSVEVENPNKHHFERIDALIKQVQQKLPPTDTASDDDTPNWLKQKQQG